MVKVGKRRRGFSCVSVRSRCILLYLKPVSDCNKLRTPVKYQDSPNEVYGKISFEQIHEVFTP